MENENVELSIKIKTGTKADLEWYLSNLYTGLVRCYGKENTVYLEHNGKSIAKAHNILFVVEKIGEEYILYENFLKKP